MIFKVNKASDYCIIPAHPMKFETLEELRIIFSEKMRKRKLVLYGGYYGTVNLR